MKTYTVSVPIAGHVTFKVNATSTVEAIAMAGVMETFEGDVSYEMLDRFTTGNVCHCPRPWEITAEEAEA